MKAKSLRPGDTIVSNGEVFIVVSVEPDDDVMTINVSKLPATEQMYFHPKETVPQPDLIVDPDAISSHFAEKIYDKVKTASEHYGAAWGGTCGSPIDCLEEELLDALAYIWIHRQITAKSLQAVKG